MFWAGRLMELLMLGSGLERLELLRIIGLGLREILGLVALGLLKLYRLFGVLIGKLLVILDLCHLLGRFRLLVDFN